jgi:hypothetical protein
MPGKKSTDKKSEANSKKGDTQNNDNEVPKGPGRPAGLKRSHKKPIETYSVYIYRVLK